MRYQASRSCDYNIRTQSQTSFLLLEKHSVITAVHSHAAHRHEIGETLHLLVYLLRQLPCRCHYYTVDGIFGMPAFRKLVQYGQQVRGGFSGSGLCNSYQIPAFEYNWY